MSSPRSVPVARSQTVKTSPSYASRTDYRQPSAARSVPSQRNATGPTRYQQSPTRTESFTREPIRRGDRQTSVTPRKSGPGSTGSSPYGSRSFGDRNWTDSGGQYPSGGRPGYGDGDGHHGGGGGPGYDYNDGHHRHPYHHHGHYPGYGYPYHHRYPYYYPYYHRYGYYRPYGYYPPYSYYYPYFYPTFSFGLSWGSPYYYDSYYASPSVVYAEPTTIVETVPAYTSGTTYYADAPAYVDSDTAYVATTPVVEGESTTTVERQYMQPGQASTSISLPSQSNTSASQRTAPPAEQQQAPAKEPDPRVLAAVGKGNEHFGAGRYEDARRSYGEAMLIDTKDGVAKLLFGVARFAEADYASSATTIREALDATPDLIWYPFNIKALYRNESRFQEHVATLARHVDSQPGDTPAQFLLGYMWYASGDAMSAKTIFSSLSTNNPSDDLFMALRDAATQAQEAMSKQQSQGQTRTTPPAQPPPAKP